MRRWIISTGIILFASLLWGQPFPCTGQFYLALTPAGSTTLYEIEIDPITGNATFDPLPFGQNTGDNVNSVGYRSTDNFIYGVTPSTGELFRVEATGQAFSLGFLTGLNPNYLYYNGDITPDGNTLVLIGTSNAEGDRELVQVDLNDPGYATTVTPLTDLQSGGIPFTRSADIAFDPLTGRLYGYDGTSGRLVEYDVANSTVDADAFPVNGVATAMGSMFFDAFGQLYGYGLVTGGTVQNTLFKIDKVTGDVTIEASGPSAQGTDGCSCPYNVEFRKIVYPRETVVCTEVTYAFEISNQSGGIQNTIDFSDVLPPGFTITEIVANPFGGTIAAGTGVGTGALDINGMSIPLGIDSIVVKVDVGSVPGTYRNQAGLSGLPTALGTFVLSDDPSTIIADDSTTLLVEQLIINLGNDTLQLCGNDSLTLQPDLPGIIAVDYQWSDGSTDTILTVYQEGLYSVTVSSGCEVVIDSVFVNEANVPYSNTITVDSVDCAGGSDGSITVVPSGGFSGGYDYTWSPTGPNSGNYTGLGAGTYLLTVTDGLGCPFRDTIEVAEPPPLTATAQESMPASCDYTADGVALATPSGGSGGYTYIWSDPGAQTTPTATQLPGNASYTVTITDINGCTTTAQTTVTAPPALVIDLIALEAPTCNGDSNALLQVDAQGGTPGYAYSWAGGPATPTFDNLTAGDYTLTVTDFNNCEAVTTYNIPETPALEAVFEVEPIVCRGEGTGSITVIGVENGTPGFTYLWEDGQTTATIDELPQGDYIATITDANGCLDTATATVVEPQEQLTVESIGVPVICFGDSTGAILPTPTGGFAPYTYSSDGITFSADDSQISGYPAGTAILYVRDSLGCTILDTVEIPDVPELFVELGDDIEIPLGCPIELVPISNSTDSLAYQWTEATNSTPVLTCPDCEIQELIPLDNGTYGVTITDQDGCIADDDVDVVVLKYREIYIPNAFSPNDDGMNDIFRPYPGKEVQAILSFRVFDKWGNHLYERTPLDLTQGEPGWDGTSRGQPMQPGVYTWMMEVEFIDGFTLLYSGDVTLIE